MRTSRRRVEIHRKSFCSNKLNSDKIINSLYSSAAKHYSVTPLGAHSGLITWVDGMTPIFALYKKWQQRQATNLKKEKSPTNSVAAVKNTPPQAIARPSELYFQKLTPLLIKHNIKATQSCRKEWPLHVLKEVLADLTGMHFNSQLTYKQINKALIFFSSLLNPRTNS